MLGIMDALCPVLLQQLDVIHSNLTEKFFYFIKSVVLETHYNQSYETPEQTTLRDFIILFLKFLNTYKQDDSASKYLEQNSALIKKIRDRFHIHDVDDSDIKSMDQVIEIRSNMTLRQQQQQQSLERFKPELLINLIPQLLDLLITDTALLAYAQLLRILHYRPELSNIIIPYYLSCLKHHSESVRLHAIQFAYDLFPYCSNKQSDTLLRLLFESGRKEGLNMLSRIMNMYIKL